MSELKTVEDGQATYPSIHYRPPELLAQNRGTAARLTRRVGQVPLDGRGDCLPHTAASR